MSSWAADRRQDIGAGRQLSAAVRRILTVEPPKRVPAAETALNERIKLTNRKQE